MTRECVWDYPRPPRLEPSGKRVRILVEGECLAESSRPVLIKETSHPPVYFLPPEDVQTRFLEPTSRTSFCEWKGLARYYDVVVHERVLPAAAFVYERPTERYSAIAGYYSFYAGPMDEVTVDGEAVVAQEGQFYSGWITNDLRGPFKGGPGTWGW